MSRNKVSPADLEFVRNFELCALPPAQFDHRAHVRLAYVYLADRDTAAATAAMRESLQRFLQHNGVDPAKYHETITAAWIMAVRHFIQLSGDSASADEFIDANPALLDTRIMLTHYSAETLFSPDARAQFVAPDIAAIPRHD